MILVCMLYKSRSLSKFSKLKLKSKLICIVFGDTFSKDVNRRTTPIMFNEFFLFTEKRQEDYICMVDIMTDRCDIITQFLMNLMTCSQLFRDEGSIIFKT